MILANASSFLEWDRPLNSLKTTQCWLFLERKACLLEVDLEKEVDK